MATAGPEERRERFLRDTAELVTRAQSGDTEALRQLLEGVWPDAYRIAWSVVRDASLAEDVAQEACSHVLRSIGSLRHVETFPVWFYRIVAREAQVQSRRRGRDGPLDTGVIEAAHSQEPGRVEDRIDLGAALAGLAPGYRLPLVLHYYRGLSSAEIGRAMGLPAATVRFRMARARRVLRRLLKGSPEPPGARRTEPRGER